MFWKRKKTEPELIEFEIDDKRSSFRVCPHKKFPVYVKVSDIEVLIVDIGAGGMAFSNIDFKAGNQYTAAIKLPDHEKVISVEIHILSIDRRDFCHCCFKTIEEDDVNAIHKYMLEVQKEEIRERKAAAKSK